MYQLFFVRCEFSDLNGKINVVCKEFEINVQKIAQKKGVSYPTHPSLKINPTKLFYLHFL